MSVGKIRSSFQAAQTQRKNDVVTAKELRSIVNEAKKDDNAFDAAEKSELAKLAGDAIANNKMSAAAQREYAKLQNVYGIHDTRTQPEWIGNAYTVIERSGEAGRAVASPIVYDSWARQRAATRELRFEAWVPGLTDRDDPELWKKLDAKVHFRFAGETQFHEAPIDFKRRSGNNALYAMNLERFDPWFAPYLSSSAVKGLKPQLASENGTQVAKLEVFFTLNGKPFRPGVNENFHVSYENSGPLP